MINLKANRLTKHLASSAVAIGIITGIGISIPAQAVNVVCLGTGDCPSTPLSDLFGPNMSYQVGDKLFDNWRNFISVSTGGASAPTLADIFVTGFKTGPSWYDLRFTTSDWTVNSGQSIDTSWQYDVTSLDTPIYAVDLSLIGHATNGTGTITVTETVTPLIPGPSVPVVTLLAQNNPPGPTIVERALIPPQQKISIAKDVALVGHANGSAAISILGQSYHQSTPEPSSLLGLLAFGGLGLNIIRKQANK